LSIFRQALKPGLNLSPAFFLKKIATFAAAPYHKVGGDVNRILNPG